MTAGNLLGCRSAVDDAVSIERAVTAPIAFVQSNYADPQVDSTTVTVPFTAAQGAGNLNVVVVGWNDTTAVVNAVTDSKGNVYQLAVGPTKQTTALTQSIYYAKNVVAAAAGTNSVTVTYSAPAVYADIRIAEYSGIDTANPLDVAIGANGSSTISSTGSVTTTNASDLLVMGNMVATGTVSVSSGFTMRMITSPDGDGYADRVVSAAGAQTGSFSLSGAGAWVVQMAAFKAAVLDGDTQAPTAPADPVATAASLSQINLSWTAATDNVAVTSYLIERCAGASCSSFAQVGTSTTTSFADSGLTAQTSYSYRVRATDAANNLGPYSATASAMTLADTQAPTAPSNLAASVISSTQINLAWTAASDNLAVTGYLVERCAGTGCTSFAEIATPTTTTLNDTMLSALTSYSYRVRARDAAGNLGPYSNVAGGTTPFVDTQPPTAPTGLTAVATSSSQVSLTWTDSIDDVGVTAYLIERCTGADCTSFTQIATATTASFGDSGLALQTSYSYRVRARDAANNIGPYSAVASAVTLGDTQAPTAPSGLTATVISATQINLAWTAATDNVGVTGYRVERCTGAGCTSFAQIATPTALTLNDTGLTSQTSYSYRVRATDAAGNLGPYSNVATGATPFVDTQPPTAPSALAATATSSSQVNLTWTASTDDVAVTAYLIERCTGAGCTSFTQIATSTTASYGDSGLTAATSYVYRVRARDAANNVGGYSNTASATTQAAPPPPTTPTFVQVAYADPQTPQTAVTVTYAAAQLAGGLNVVLAGWNDSTAQITSVTDSAGNTYALAVGPTAVTGRLTQSIYYAKNIVASAAGANSVTVTFNVAAQYPDIRILEYKGVDTASPLDATATATGTATISDSGSATLTSANDLIVAGNMVYSSTTGPGTGFTSRAITNPDGDIAEDRVVTAAGSYNATAMLSGAGSWVMQMAAFKPASGNSDTQAPTAPSNLAATAVSSSQIDLAWTAATDNVGVTNYLIERCQGAGCSNFVQIASTTSTTFANNTGLTGLTSYSYRVRATDAANNMGPYSPVAGATTLGDTQPPTAPSGLTATPVSSSQINLAWTAATDDVGVTGYLVERCQGSGCTNFAQVTTTTTTALFDAGLNSWTRYVYRVRATDAAGNLGPYSATATAITPFPDTQAPTAPGSLTATATSPNQVSLAWLASTDNTGVTGYLVERCTGTGCASFAQIGSVTTLSYGDSGLTPQTTYQYQVRATDAAGNLGPYSAVAAVTTQGVPLTPTFVQSAYAAPQTPQTTVSVTFTAAQTAGDLNVVLVGWNDSAATVSAVTDTAGNTYSLAVGPTVYTGYLTQSIYYAKNITGSAAGNVVRVQFSAAAVYPDVRILEYSGIDTSVAVDKVVGATGTATICDSGSVTTTNASDLLVAGNMVYTSTVSAGTGFTSRMITSPNGDFVEDRVVSTIGTYNATANLSGAGPWIMQLVAFRSASGAPPPPDTTPPTVSISSPAAGATVNGQVNVTIDASDSGSGVASVQLLVDGIPFGSPDTIGPFSITLDTTQFLNDVHSIGAYAVDFASNVGNAAPITVTFSNSIAQGGQWSNVIQLPIVPVHSALLRTGEIFMWDAQELGGSGGTWNPITQVYTASNLPANLFCAGLNQLPDGRLLIVGGHIDTHIGLPDLNVFDPGNRTWTRGPNMQDGRWYPGTVTLGDGRQLILSGESTCNGCFVPTPEIYNPTTNTKTSLTAAPFTFSYYPHAYLLADGRVLVSSTTETPIVSQILDVNAQTWTPIGGPAVDGGSSVMYRPGKVLKTGTSVDPDLAVRQSASTAYVLDTTQPSPTWRQVASMGFRRTFHTLTMLPDGTVLVTGGGPTTAATDVVNAVKAAEIWSPDTETWTTVAAGASPRLYHSEALLLPDGRVLVFGGGRFNGINEPTNQLNAEFYSPPYLFKGARPTITSAPAALTYAQPFTVQTPNSASIASVALVRLGAVTHSSNMAQVYVPLSFTAGSGSLTVTAPINGNLAPPGYYMLFIVDTNGVPSVAAITHF